MIGTDTGIDIDIDMNIDTDIDLIGLKYVLTFLNSSLSIFQNFEIDYGSLLFLSNSSGFKDNISFKEMNYINSQTSRTKRMFVLLLISLP